MFDNFVKNACTTAVVRGISTRVGRFLGLAALGIKVTPTSACNASDKKGSGACSIATRVELYID